jgi:GeoRSP system SPASM domain protein
MSPEQSFNPFIVYWDINSSTSDVAMVNPVCDGLLKTGIFILNIRDLSKTLSPSTLLVLERLAGERLEINLTSRAALLEGLASEQERMKGINTIYIEEEYPQQIEQLLKTMALLKNEGFRTGLSFPVEEQTFRNIPAVVSLCIGNDIKNLQIPIQRYHNRDLFCVDPKNARWLAAELKHIDMESLNLSVHDPFLWGLFHQKDNPNEEGCNGARTMIYISEDLDVTPCPIIPVSMGSLRHASLEEIVSSESRKRIRKELSSSPGECMECSLVKTCRGGCRGRTYLVNKSFDRRDPACFIRN